MKRRRVKITGIGPVTPAGIGREAFWSGILEPVSRVRPYDRLDANDGPLVAAYLNRFNIADYVDKTRVPKGTARHALFAVAGAQLALNDAGLDASQLKDETTMIVVGSSLLDFGSIGDAIESVNKRGARGAQARVVYTASGTSTPNAINLALGKAARTMSMQTSCCSGLDAMGYAADLIASGEVDVALCGGTEAPLHRFPILELRAAGLTPETTDLAGSVARPFDLWRTTGVISEGACMFVLEPEDSPRPGYGFIAGYAFANDAYLDLCGGLVSAGRLAMAQAGVRPVQIDAINAWGPGHKLIDQAEAVSLVRLFGDQLKQVPVVSIKGAIGNALGATPAIQVAAAVLAQRHALLPPTVNWRYPDPACPLNLSAQPRAVPQSCTLVNAHGVGSVNACMVLTPC